MANEIIFVTACGKHTTFSSKEETVSGSQSIHQQIPWNRAMQCSRKRRQENTITNGCASHLLFFAEHCETDLHERPSNSPSQKSFQEHLNACCSHLYEKKNEKERQLTNDSAPLRRGPPQWVLLREVVLGPQAFKRHSVLSSAVSRAALSSRQTDQTNHEDDANGQWLHSFLAFLGIDLDNLK